MPEAGALSHIDISVGYPQRSIPFYDALLTALGYRRWQIDMPENWDIEELDDAVSLFNPDSSGTLLISTIKEDEIISDEYLEELVSDHIDAGADLHDVECGEFDGVSCCYEADAGYWCEWYLRHGAIMLFVTYDCALEDEGNEDDLVDSMLETLAIVHRANIH